MNIFIIGATGYIGHALAKKFSHLGHNVSGLARTPEKATLLESNGITPVLGDLETPASFVQAIRNADIVIHAGFVFDPAKGLAHTIAVETNTVRHIIDQLSPDKLFIYTSGTGVLGDTGPKPVDEDFQGSPVEFIAWRPAIEQQVINASGIKGIVIRPGMVYHDGDKPTEQAPSIQQYQPVKRGGPTKNDDGLKRDGPVIQMLGRYASAHGHTFYIGDGLQQWSVIHLDDLCTLYYQATIHAKKGNIYHATADEAISMKYLAQVVSKQLGISAEPRSVTVQEAATHLPIAGLLSINVIADNGKAKRLLDWRPARTFR